MPEAFCPKVDEKLRECLATRLCGRIDTEDGSGEKYKQGCHRYGGERLPVDAPHLTTYRVLP